MTTFARFNIVGLAGFILQLCTLAALDGVGVPLPVAACLAVEAAILHNFAWHERWTWAGMADGTRGARLVRFHLANGLVSIAGNAAITTASVGAGVPLLLASAAAVLTCSALNFAVAHLWVFAPEDVRSARLGRRLC